jgi:pimeloyl-ACP methyl ester carboxylesterase
MGSPMVGDRLDDRALIRQQLRDTSRSLLRPSSWAGLARELALTSLHLAAYPLGIAAAELSAEPAAPPRRVLTHPALEATPDHADMPVILVHGWVHNRSAFLWMTRALRRAGFRTIHSLNYNPMKQGIREIAQSLAIEVDRVLAVTGAPRCMVVGHSMGGIVARYYVQALGGHRNVDTVVTLGSPHRGTYTAHLGLGPAARELQPRTPIMRELEETARPSGVRWIAYWSDLDLMVAPAVNGKLIHPALAATNIRTRDTGHLSLLLSGEVLRSVVDHLADRELGWTGEHPRPAAIDIPDAARFHRPVRALRAVPERPALGTSTS